MELACNYSLPLMDILSSESIPGVPVAWIKLSMAEAVDQQLEQTRSVRPVLLHTLGRAGSDVSTHGDLALLDQQLARAGSPHVAVHCESTAEDLPFPVDLRWQSSSERTLILDRLVHNVAHIKSLLSVPLLIENVPYYGFKGGVRAAAEPEAMALICRETGVDLLLDVSHSFCAADHLGLELDDYWDALPLDRVREIHISGPRFVAGEGLRDRHHELRKADYQALDQLLERVRPPLLTLEYGGFGVKFETPERNDPAALRRQLQALAERL